MRLSARIGWFLVAGTCGFATDAAVLTGLMALGVGPRAGRLVSFALAMVVTWLINRRRAFGDRAGPPSLAEFGRYAAASSVAAGINLALYMALVTLGGVFADWPVLALAAATAISMCVNFWSYFRVVFAAKPPPSS
jgi:putative flippase GtrA